MKKALLLLYSLFILFPCLAIGEQEISIGHEGMTFVEFANDLSDKYQIKVFFDKNWVENIRLKKSYSNENITAILSDILAGTQFRFLVRNNSIVLTKYEDVGKEFSLREKVDRTTKMVESVEEDKDFSNLQEQEYKIHEIGTALGKKKVKLFGKVSHFESSQPLKGVSIFLPNLTKGVTSDKDGYFELDLPPGFYTLNFRYMGLKPSSRKINLRGDGRINVQLLSETKTIKEVRVLAKDDKVRRTSMGIEYIQAKDIESLPSALGEPDIIKSTTMLPGVESAGEGSIGFNVRGGSADQNLILIDNAPIYYPAHFFGFFSAFNNDMIQEASLYKSSIPVQFGGRISSTYDIHSNNKIADKINGKVGISPVTTKAFLNLPILKNKLSIMNSFRFTYSDWIVDKIDSKELVDSKSNFHDLHGKILYKPNSNNQFELSYYKSKDEFQLHSDTLYNFNNFVSSLNWRYRFSEKLKMNNSVYFTSFSYDMSSAEIASNAFKLTHKVNEGGFKSYLNLEKDLYTTIDLGTELKYYNISPGDMKPYSEASVVNNNNLPEENGLEAALFLGFKREFMGNITAEAGIRYSLYGNVGKREELTYLDGITNRYNILDTIITSTGLNNIYHGPEYRISVNYALNPSTSIKASYNRTRQYIHLLSNTTSISPTDTWKLSDKYLKPQIGDQISLGFYKNIFNSNFELSAETYFKKVQNAKDYKDGAQLYLNEHTENEVLNAEGKNYGVELFIRKNKGRFNTMVSYTYSRSYLKSKDNTGEFAVNDGDWYRAPYDKPHNIKAFFSFKLSRRFIFSTNLVYHTGRPATYPIAKYSLQGIPIIYYSERNEYRIPNYFRTDISLLVEGNLRKNKPYHTSWTFGLYNLTARNNAYSVYFRSEDSSVAGYKLSVFGNVIPTVSYNIEF
ncbi:TonB-dependent receptor [Labilibaculum euxinus]|uniref:TonB-dependent receptor plug domain-containing protein n=1 Tax=Labilibaculum euxinus TaxID=2686357 RepID=A0A7M4D4N6_9BACT|nr:TonB-dependent receptor [Labilibaculum euxinus]MUP37615.1 TonB-dependent receptor plug domain-containing protein [Labilibaculum euxinus]MVB06820.1 TonB-dependent receptor plug domain-containing protein [Labilibaculum euxinus]